MIVTPRFVFLHLHKSGGTFVNEFLRQFFQEHKEIGYHLPRSMLPGEYGHLPILGVVRNPWSYYVSWYVFQSARNQPNGLFRAVSDNKRLDFKNTIYNLIHLGEDLVRFELFQSLLPDHFGHEGLNLTKNCIEPFRGSSEGFYAFLYRRMFGQAEGVHTIRMETMRQELLQFLRSVGVSVTDAMEQAVLHSKKKNVTKHQPYVDYYDEDLAQTIAERDHHVIEQFGYVFERQAN